MRTNSFIKLITTELNRELSSKNFTNRNVRKREMQEYIDKMKHKIELFVRDQIKCNTIALVKCQCKHLEDCHGEQGCNRCDCKHLVPRGRTPITLALLDDALFDDDDEVLYAA